MGKKLVIVILAVLVSCGAFVALAGEDLGRLREAFRNASAGKKAEVRKLLRKELPDLQSGVLSMLERKYPALPARAGRIIVQEIDRKYPALASELPEKILKELEKEGFSPAKHAGVILDLLGSKYPDLPAEILSARKAQHVPVKMLSLICTKYPGFRTDLLGLMKDKYPGLLPSLRKDLSALLADRYPDLGVTMLYDISAMIDRKYPDLPRKVAQAKEKNPDLRISAYLAGHYPGAVKDALALVEEKHGARIRSLVVDLFKTVNEKHGAEVRALAADVLALVEKKYPTLPYEMARVRQQARRKVSAELEKKHPALGSDLAGIDPKVLAAARRVVERDYPDLRKDIAGAVSAEFPTVKREVAEFITREKPAFFEKLRKILDTKE